ncbi:MULTISPECIES: pilus assembly protein N-terminal domain-containing protein [unclassified Yoonia]|uniref:pilus assembly protein N-terminal domain-containing protein n=1 Tax=unclassified Yoonia TaxID=2629118 RepID=UPI002AFFC2FC|nr:MULTISPECIES: pilus assembly protein N-terminal domain-containing protein [unclassified Yoonia]
MPIAFSDRSAGYQATERSSSRVLAVMVDFASVLRIEGSISAIAVGNSDIADASLADPNTLILTGRTVGTTNLIALDESGGVILDVMVRVGAQKPGMVTVRRGTQIQSTECNSANCGTTSSDALPEVSSLIPAADR